MLQGLFTMAGLEWDSEVKGTEQIILDKYCPRM